MERTPKSDIRVLDHVVDRLIEVCEAEMQRPTEQALVHTDIEARLVSTSEITIALVRVPPTAGSGPEKNVFDRSSAPSPVHSSRGAECHSHR